MHTARFSAPWDDLFISKPYQTFIFWHCSGVVASLCVVFFFFISFPTIKFFPSISKALTKSLELHQGYVQGHRSKLSGKCAVGVDVTGAKESLEMIIRYLAYGKE